MNKNSLEAISAPSATIANLASETVETKWFHKTAAESVHSRARKVGIAVVYSGTGRPQSQLNSLSFRFLRLGSSRCGITETRLPYSTRGDCFYGCHFRS
jgi:hypothetical protein